LWVVDTILITGHTIDVTNFVRIVSDTIIESKFQHNSSSQN